MHNVKAYAAINQLYLNMLIFNGAICEIGHLLS